MPALGLPYSVTDTNGNVTATTYDALGRVAQVWQPNRPQASNSTPSVGYTYTLSTTSPNAVTTAAINASGATTTRDALYDGLGQLRQTQTPAPGFAPDLGPETTSGVGTR